MVKKLQARNEPRKGRGFGFVTLASEELQQQAIKEMNGKDVDGREIAVKVAIDSPGKEDDVEGNAHAGEGSAPAGEGSAPTGEGSAPTGEGSAPAGEGSAPAGQTTQPTENGTEAPVVAS